MIKVFFLAVFVFFISSCEEKVELHSSSVEVSELIYSGNFDINEIKKIGVLLSAQRTLYPEPTWKKETSVKWSEEVEFFKSFQTTLRSHSRDDFFVMEQSIHVVVILNDGSRGYLFGRSTKKGPSFGPKFEVDSFGGVNTALGRLLLEFYEQ